jgi:glutaredoxin
VVSNKTHLKVDLIGLGFSPTGQVIKKQRVKCPHCQFVKKLFTKHTIKTAKDYWIMTEVFVYLHGGKDHCDGKPYTRRRLDSSWQMK